MAKGKAQNLRNEEDSVSQDRREWGADESRHLAPRIAWWRILSDSLEEIIAASLLGIIAIAMGLQVVMRTLFDAPLGWPEELAQFLFVWASLFGAIAAIKRSELIRVEFLLDRLSKLQRRIVEGFVVIAVCAFLAILFWNGWQLASRTSFAATALPVTWAWAYAAIPVFSVFASVRLVQARWFKYDFIRIENLWPREEQKPEELSRIQGSVQ
jgi:TRAP-type C4-dicarboxylate transport system permease small subunit